MQETIKVIECSLPDGKIHDLLRYISHDQYDCYIPMCYSTENCKYSVPETTKYVPATPKEIADLESRSIWELLLHMYPAGAIPKPIETYYQFVNSSCMCCLIYYDCSSTDIYIKTHELFCKIWNKLISLQAEDLILVTNVRNYRSVLHP